MITGASLVLPTVILKAAKLACAPALSVTVITIPEVTFTSALNGVPVKAPVVVSKLAQLGAFTMLNAAVS